MLDPPIKADAPQLTGAAGAAEGLGHRRRQRRRRSTSAAWASCSAPTSPCRSRRSYPPHPITENFNLLTAFPLARSVTPVDGGANGHTAQNLVETQREQLGGNQSQEPDHRAASRAKLDEGDKTGPVSLAAAVSAPVATPRRRRHGAGQAGRTARSKPETRIVVFGDSDFASNGALGVPGNRDLFLNTVNWLAQQENLIAIRPRDPEDRRVTLTADAGAAHLLADGADLPGLVLLAGVQTWWRRR